MSAAIFFAIKKKFYNIGFRKDFFKPSLPSIKRHQFFRFFSVKMRPVVFKPSDLSRHLMYAFKQATKHSSLSVHDLYSNLPRGFPFLKLLRILFGKNVADISFIIITLGLNVLIVLRQCAPSNSNSINNF